MMVRLKVGPYSLRGSSLGGIQTAIQIEELGVLFDAGYFSRGFISADTIFISHGHADHLGALGTLLGARGLYGKLPPRIFFPAAIEEPLMETISSFRKLQRYDLTIEAMPMEPGDEALLKGDLWVRAFRTFHSIPSLGFEIFRRVQKLKPEYRELGAQEIRRLRRERGAELFDLVDRGEIVYATDTLARVLDHEPRILKSRMLILECTFLDDRKPREEAHRGGHIHIEDLLEYAERFENEHLLLMHFSQVHSPEAIREILAERLPPSLYERTSLFIPPGRHWPL